MLSGQITIIPAKSAPDPLINGVIRGPYKWPYTWEMGVIPYLKE